MGAKEAALAAHGIFAAYADVLAGYVALFGHADDGAEALARATFLVWYEMAEPACFSGLRDLPEPLVETTLARLDAGASHDALSGELTAMLGYYHSVADFAFTRGGPWPALARQLAESDPYAWHTRVPPASERWARGQMSDYWASILRVT